MRGMAEDVIVLAVHGAPPRDFPPGDLVEFFALHARLEHARGLPVPDALRARAEDLEGRMRAWPRTPENDPFWAASHQLAAELHALVGSPVMVGFNEFCDPALEGVLHAAAGERPDRVVVVTPMLTRGGEHAELDIPAAIAHVQAAHPDVPIVYAWPYATDDVARFLAGHLAKSLDDATRR